MHKSRVPQKNRHLYSLNVNIKQEHRFVHKSRVPQENRHLYSLNVNTIGR